MFKHFTIIIFIFLLVSLLLPQAVLAEDCPGGLVPCGRRCDDPNTPGDETEPCTLCHFFILIQKLLNGIGIALISWAGLFILIGGFVILSAAGSVEKVAQGKKMITYAIIGVVIGFGAWLIINTVMNAVVGEQEEAVQEKRIPWPWNKIECYTPSSGEPTPTGGEYCVCEVPIYDLDPSAYSAQAKVFAKNVKTTKLASKEECNNKCNMSYAGNYCPARQPGVDYSFSCRAESYVKNTSATGLKYPDFMPNAFCIFGCFQTEGECANSTNVGDTNFESCGRNCFFMGRDYCACRDVGVSGCSSDKRWALTRTRNEGFCGGSSLWDCTTSSECYCRLGGKPRFGEKCERCSPITTGPNWCQRSAPSGSGNWPYTSSQMKAEQKGDASIDLISFLNCFYSKPEMQSYPLISISDNHLCDGTCKIEGNTCSDVCQHSCQSGHYGCGVSSSCYGFSLAADINIEDGNTTQEAAINKAAEECRKAFGWGMIRCLGPSNDPTGHNNHIHIGIAPAFSDCNCDNIQNVDQACVMDLLGN